MIEDTQKPLPFRRQKVDSSSENLLLTGMIVSDQVAANVAPYFNRDYLVSEYARKVGQWAHTYFKEYGKAPLLDIVPIYNQHKGGLDDATAELIGDFLTKLSNEYADESGECFTEGSFNHDYVIDRSLKFLQSREIEIKANNALHLLAQGDTQLAKEEFESIKSIDRPKSKSSSPFDPDMINKIYGPQDDTKLFQLDGDLGRLMGPFKRGWLIAFTAAFKRGKSWFLMHLANDASRNRLKVLYVSCEMKIEDVHNRLHRIMSLTPRTTSNIVRPVLDCVHNQAGTCTQPDGPRGPSIFDDADVDDKPKRKKSQKFDCSDAFRVFKKVSEREGEYRYSPCSKCKEEKGNYNYEFSLWWEKKTVEGMDIDSAKRMARRQAMHYGNNIRVLSAPRFTITQEDIDKEMARLESEENFLVDVLIIDHADNMKVPNKFNNRRENVDENWKNMARSASERDILLITATQGNRAALAAATVEQDHVSENIDKLAHVDGMFSINQTKTEKSMGLARIGVMVHRHIEFDEISNCSILQAFGMGGVVLGSQITFNTNGYE